MAKTARTKPNTVPFLSFILTLHRTFADLRLCLALALRCSYCACLFSIVTSYCPRTVAFALICIPPRCSLHRPPSYCMNSNDCTEACNCSVNLLLLMEMLERFSVGHFA